MTNIGETNASYTQTNDPVTGSFNLAHYKSSAYEVYTYQTITGLPNGVYTLQAFVKSTGGQICSQMYINGYGDTQLTADIPAASVYKLIQIIKISMLQTDSVQWAFIPMPMQTTGLLLMMSL